MTLVEQRACVQTWPDGRDQHIHLVASPPTGRPRPAVLCVHGGGFSGGYPEGWMDFGRRLAGRYEVVVASTSYRLVPTAFFPTPIHDVAAAVAWLRRQSGTWDVDPQRIGMIGDSAGGYLSSMVALTLGDVRLGGFHGTAPGIQALVVQWGPLDFIARWYGNGGKPGAEGGLLQTVYTEDPTLYHYASALSHLHAEAPPALFIYSPLDQVVHPQQGELGLAAWRRHGRPAELHTYPGVGHVAGNAADQEAANADSERFLASTLGLRPR